MNDQVVELTEEDQNVVCNYCHRSTINSLEWGPLYSYGGVTVHYFCLLFSAGLSQNGEDTEGILGFLPVDIKKELKRGDKLRCKFCKNTRATIGCSVKSCKYGYHYPCGLEAKCAFHFLGNFESYCTKHNEIKKIPLPKVEWECPICFTDVAEDELPLWPPCCKKRVFHKRCIMEMAKNHGAHFFKCPLCNDKDKFAESMKKCGVYVPDRDATWETGNAFADHQRLYSRCDAVECLCPKGRDHSSKTDSKPWKVVRCGACGAAGIHKRCGELNNLTWRCPTCSRILTDKQKTDTLNSSRIQRHQYDESSSEDETNSTVSSIREVITPVPVEVRSSSGLGPQTSGNSARPAAGSRFKLFDAKNKNYVVEQDDHDSFESDKDSDSSDQSQSEEENEPVFISHDAVQKILERQKRPAVKSTRGDSSRTKRMRQEPQFTDISDPVEPITSEQVGTTPSFPLLEKDTVIKSRSKETVALVKVTTPEVLNEMDTTANVRISRDSVYPVPAGSSSTMSSSTDTELEIISIKSASGASDDVVDVDDEDSSDELVIVSERVKPMPATKSSTLIEILDSVRGSTVSKSIKPPVVRLGLDDHENDCIQCVNFKVDSQKSSKYFSRLPFRQQANNYPHPISNAFLSMIKKMRNKPDASQAPNRSEQPKPEVIDLID